MLNASTLMDAAKRIATWAGLDVRRNHPRSSPDALRARLLRELGVSVVLDAGANRGQYARALRRGGYAGRIVSFEPLREPFAELSRVAAGDPRWECRQVALGAEAGPAAMNVSAVSASSSLLPAAEARFDVPEKTRFVRTESVQVARLEDAAAGAVGSGDVAFLKLDVQGSELAVLAGTGTLMARVAALEVELSLAPLYAGQPLYREVLDVLAAEGFAVFSLAPSFADQTTGRLLQVDAICVREP